MKPHRISKSLLFATFAPAAFAAASHAQVILDGTLGPAGALGGPNVVVPASSGTTVGSNLFHSFSRLDVAAGESVTFTGPGSVQNVLARVTNGAASNINGLLRCDIAGADLYVINPAGVIFGPGAGLEVRGSFAVSSADFIRLGTGGGRFDARVPGQSVLTSSPPGAFGFAGAPAGAITVRGVLGVEPGRGVSVVSGGGVQIVGGQILAASGTANVVAGISGEATLTASPTGPLVEHQPTQAAGDVEITDGAAVDVSGSQPGRVTIRGGSLTIRNASASSGASFSQPSSTGPLAIDVSVAGSLEIGVAGFLSTATTGPGPSGDIRVGAGGDITIDRQGAGPTVFTGIGTRSASTGAGGDITVEAAGTLAIRNGGRILATGDAGPGGDIAVTAQSLDLSAGGQIVAQARGEGSGGDVTLDVAALVSLVGDRAAITSDTVAAGDGGTIDLTAADLRVADTAFVSATTNGSGAGGDITVNVANRIDLDGLDKPDFTGIGSNTQADDLLGRGGSVNITTRDMRILDGAGVAAKTFGGPEGGSVQMNVSRELLIRGQSTTNLTGLNAQALNAGAGGNLTVDAGRVVLDKGQLVADAQLGRGGNIALRGEPVILSTDSLINASSQFGVDGSVLVEGQENDFTNALVRLPGALATGAALQPQCGAMLTGDVSSFVATGRGGAPLVPGSWSAALAPAGPARAR